MAKARKILGWITFTTTFVAFLAVSYVMVTTPAA